MLTQAEFDGQKQKILQGGVTMSFGPMQLLVIGFEGGEFTGEIAAEFKRLREHDVVRLVDALAVTKDERRPRDHDGDDATSRTRSRRSSARSSAR